VWGNPVGKLSEKSQWEKSVGKLSGKSQWENSVGKPSGKTRWGNPSGKRQWENTVGKSNGKPQWKIQWENHTKEAEGPRFELTPNLDSVLMHYQLSCQGSAKAINQKPNRYEFVRFNEDFLEF
jgi:hypothetical protein